MRLWRVVGAIGRTMIAAGAILLLFVAYQLWGTGLSTAQAQERLADELARKQQALAAVTTTSTTTPVADPGVTTTTQAGLAELGQLPDVQAQLAAAPPPGLGDPLGRVNIPKIGSDFIYVEGVDLSVLQDGPGHFPSTPFPGQAGNAALAGHRTTFKAPFNRIDELVPGDTITIDSLQGRFTYEVLPQPDPRGGPDIGHFIIRPDETWILDQTEGENTLTLMACHPKYDLKERIVVKARLIDTPAPPTPRSVEATADGDATAIADLGTTSLTGNQPEARTAAIAWALLALAVWFVAWALTKRFRRARWPIWIGGFVVFCVPLFFAFDNVNKLLPAGY